MGKIQKNKAIFEYKMSDIEVVLSNLSEANEHWIKILNRAKERIQELKQYYCNECDHPVSCEECVLDIINSMDMEKLFDNLNLNLAPYSVENSIDSFSQKASDEKIFTLVGILFYYKNKIIGKNGALLCDLEDAAVSVISHKNTDTDIANKILREKIHRDLLENFWKHICVYQDHERILTEKFDYMLSEEDLTILKKSGEEEAIPNFNTIRPVTFMDYERNMKKDD